jgi:branched-chain amino acid transport system ATP-binding protein
VTGGDAVLALDGVSKRYGKLRAVDDVTLSLARGARHAIIGPNGAGKSTLFHLIAGTVRPSSGRIVFQAVDVTRRRPHRRAHLGMSRTFQQSSLFDGLSAHDNVAIAVQRQLGHGRNVVRAARRFRDVSERSTELLALLDLERFADTPARSLSHGHRRQLEVALALATDPSLLLMDEPTAGMSRDEAQRLLAIIGGLPASLTIALVEHDMDVVFGFASEITVLDAGRLIANGPPEAIRESAAVQEAYLGPGDRMETLFTSA